jgi:hypothetical protein
MKTKILSSLAFSLFISTAGAALEPNQVREALPKKTESYLKEGLISGGDREIRAGIVKDVRRATNGGFERIVVDIDAEKAPYYQAAIDPAARRILVTLYGSPKLAINAKKIVEQYPIVEEDSWTFALYLRSAVPVEVFELTAPTRIIFDLKGGAGLVAEVAPPAPVGNAAHSAKRPVTRVVPTHPKSSPAKPKAIRANPVEDEYKGNGAANHAEDIPE